MAKGNVWNALAGMGAGFQGRGAEWAFNQDMARREAEMIEQQRRQQRVQEVAAQNRVYLTHLQNGNHPQARAVADEAFRNAVASNQHDIADGWGQRLQNLADGKVQFELADAESDDIGFSTRGILEPMGGGDQGDPAELRVFNELTRIASDPNEPQQRREAARIKLGQMARKQPLRTVDLGGVSYAMRDDGTLIPMTLDGKPVTPETVAANTSTIANAKGSGTAAANIAKDTFTQLQPVTKSITNLHAAIRAIDDGADTGVIASKFPSVTEASITLDNIRNQMGLDVIGATTFGALSESELAFALDTAMPDALDEKELRGWLVRKAESQKKLRAELIKAAKYMSKPSATIAGYLEFLEGKGQYKAKQMRSVEDIMADL